VTFDDERLVADAGLVLPATLAAHLGLEATADALIDLGEAPGASRPGRKVMTLVHAIAAGADCIDDVDVLRAGSTEAVLGHRVMAPSTCGTFLRGFTFGHVRQLDRFSETALGRRDGGGPISDQASLWPDWRHHAFITNRAGDLLDIEADHHRHAVIELAVRYLTMPGRLTRRARREHLVFPARWPWAHEFLRALERVRVIPLRA